MALYTYCAFVRGRDPKVHVFVEVSREGDSLDTAVRHTTTVTHTAWSLLRHVYLDCRPNVSPCTLRLAELQTEAHFSRSSPPHGRTTSQVRCC